MKTESIIRTLDGLFGSAGLCETEHYNLIDTLVVSRLDFDGSILEVDYNDLKNFPKLYNLTLDNCMIDNNVIQVLTELPNLKRLSIINCDVLEDIKENFNKLNILDLYICNTNFNLSYLNKNYRKVRIEEVPFATIPGSIKCLDIYNCEIPDIDELLKTKFDEVMISNELYLTNQLKFDDSNRKISVLEENGQFLVKKVGY